MELNLPTAQKSSVERQQRTFLSLCGNLLYQGSREHVYRCIEIFSIKDVEDVLITK